ncbi:hypothetical protein EDC04DRAFT_2888471 [Pisolithus marmoratus]|nr:hypothetical protein EDC04DRAFT_2888471 [Pisolithus marmoratus]
MSSVTGSEVAIDTFIDEIRPSFNYIVADAACSGCLFTLLVVLLGFSTKESRRRLVFQLNWEGNSRPVQSGVNESLLLLLSSLSTRRYLKIFAFPFCIKCARVAVLALWFNDYVKFGSTIQALVQNQGAIWYRNRNMTAEWTMQTADNLYSVSFFLYNLHVRTSSIRSVSGISERIRQIFYISAANFVFPLLFNIAQIILITADRSPYTGSLVLLINNFVTVIGILCATLWLSGSEWVRGHKEALADAEDFARWGGDRFHAASDVSEGV